MSQIGSREEKTCSEQLTSDGQTDRLITNNPCLLCLCTNLQFMLFCTPSSSQNSYWASWHILENTIQYVKLYSSVTYHQRLQLSGVAEAGQQTPVNHCCGLYDLNTCSKMESVFIITGNKWLYYESI